MLQNETAIAFLREEIKTGLNMLPEGWQRKFKLMYGQEFEHGKSKYNIEQIVARDINDIVDSMEAYKLDHALTQVENSLKLL